MKNLDWKRPVANWLLWAGAVLLLLGCVAGALGALGPRGPAALLGASFLLGFAGLILDGQS